MTILVDRDTEQKELSALIGQQRPTLALLTGRRRVGKTFLLTHAWPSEQLFLFTAARTTPELNRQQLLHDFMAWSGKSFSSEDYPTWRTIFRLLVDVAERRAAGTPSMQPPVRTVVVLDEFQYLAEGDAGLATVASELNAVWEQLQRRHPPRPSKGKSRGTSRAISNGTSTQVLPFLMVLAGSVVATMEALAGGGAPLYGRFDWHHKLQPFTYWHAAELAPFPDLRDRALTYGIFGGTPRYLSAIDTSRSLIENAADLILSPRGEIRLLIETALDQEEGLRDVSKYRAILRAVADGCTERNEIAQRTGLPNDNALREKLGTLVDLGYLEQRRNVDAKPNAAVRYAIADAAFRFYHRFVAPNASILERYPASQVWASIVAPHLDSYMGFEFERIATQAYDRRAIALGLPLVGRWGRWEGLDATRLPLEIDLVAPLDHSMMTGAVKWDRFPIGVGVHREHLEMLKRAAAAGRGWAHAALQPTAPFYYLAAGGFASGFREEVEAGGHPSVCWALSDVYAAKGVGAE